MQNTLFSKSFSFNTFKMLKSHFTDNSGGCEYHYIGFMKKGSVVLVENSNEITLTEGDCFYIPQNCSYRSFWSGKPEIEFLSFAFRFFPNPENAQYKLQKINLSSTELDTLLNINTNQDHTALNIGKFYAFLGTVFNRMEKSFVSKKCEIVSNAIEYMSKNSNFKIRDVAEFCNVSESGLYSVFRTVKGCTPIDVKHELQIEKAKTLLCSTDLKIEHIAEICGFCSVIYFRKVFKKVTGKNPRQIRKLNTP